MNTLVIYDSQYGNTERVAQIIPAPYAPLGRHGPRHTLAICPERTATRAWTFVTMLPSCESVTTM